MKNVTKRETRKGKDPYYEVWAQEDRGNRVVDVLIYEGKDKVAADTAYRQAKGG